MFRLFADKNKLTLLEREAVTSGSVNAYGAEFQFSEDWAGLARVAVFQAGCTSREALLGPEGACVVPWEVLRVPRYHLKAGVCGKQGEAVVLPTIWADLGVILEGVPAGGSPPPTPELWEQELGRKGDGLGYTKEGELGLYSGDKLLSAVPVSGGGGEGGTTDHRSLSNRDAEGQHPMGAIEGLEDEIRRIPAPMRPLTNSELEELLK